MTEVYSRRRWYGFLYSITCQKFSKRKAQVDYADKLQWNTSAARARWFVVKVEAWVGRCFERVMSITLHFLRIKTTLEKNGISEHAEFGLGDSSSLNWHQYQIVTDVMQMPSLSEIRGWTACSNIVFHQVGVLQDLNCLMFICTWSHKSWMKIFDGLCPFSSNLDYWNKRFSIFRDDTFTKWSWLEGIPEKEN